MKRARGSKQSRQHIKRRRRASSDDDDDNSSDDSNSGNKSLPAFGSSVQADDGQRSKVSATVASERHIGISTLSNLCAQVFVSNLSYLQNGQGTSRDMETELAELPVHIAPKLFSMLRQRFPENLTSAFIIKVRLANPAASHSYNSRSIFSKAITWS